MVEPIEIRLEQSALRFGLVHAVAEVGIKDHPGFHALILEAAIKFVTVRNGHALVIASLLDQCGSLSLLDGGDRRGLGVNFRIVPRSGVEILAGERRDVGVYVVSHPIADASAFGNSSEAVG